MKVKKVANTFEFTIEGAIGEGSPLFLQDIREATRIELNLEKMSYINSIGVKHWILWTMRVPKSAEFIIKSCPLVMINQAATVVGFLPPTSKIESFAAPYVCTECGTERMLTLKLGQDYEYASPQSPKRLTLPSAECHKCQSEMEPDFLEAKVFTFLDRK